MKAPIGDLVRDVDVLEQSPAACKCGSARVLRLEQIEIKDWDDGYILVYDETTRKNIVEMLREGGLA